ncbi:MAG: amidohydrolase family protein [Chitinophagaceae bacterium]|nr:amidohydrolase family protein [Chitinophagaceae bacterium]
MKWYSADEVFLNEKLCKDVFLGFDNENYIKKIIFEKPNDNVQFFDGILSPGFVNAHCHLELSYLHQQIDTNLGLIPFLEWINKNRNSVEQEKIFDKIAEQDNEMYQNGIQAVGDICNTDWTIETKIKSKIQYHSFVELVGVNEKIASQKIDEGKLKQKLFEENNLKNSLAIHAPYSCSGNLIEKICVENKSNILSIHMQESDEENLLFQKKENQFLAFYKNMNIEALKIDEINLTSFEAIEKKIKFQQNSIFVHNTFTTNEDIKMLQANQYFCFCPKANLYIENRLPDVNLFLEKNNQLVLGTDSLASNNTLNIWEEILVFQKYFPEIPLQNYLKWATINGAKALKMDNKIGSFEVGKQPGLINISNKNIIKRIL